MWEFKSEAPGFDLLAGRPYSQYHGNIKTLHTGQRKKESWVAPYNGKEAQIFFRALHWDKTVVKSNLTCIHLVADGRLESDLPHLPAVSLGSGLAPDGGTVCA